jgi:putative glutamine amidotransferase
MVRQIITAGYSGYTRPYQAALGDKYEYTCITDPKHVAGINWDDVEGVVFTGGADIDPKFYGEAVGPYTHCDSWHDALDEAMLKAMDEHAFDGYKFGTCRGAQLLFAHYLRGKLIQDIPHHERDHPAFILPYDVQDDRESVEYADTLSEIPINSLHHQACIWESISDTGAPYQRENEDEYSDYDVDEQPILLLVGDSEGQTAVEAWQGAESNCLGFQYHPEWLDDNDEGYKWSIAAIQAFAGVGKEHEKYRFPTSYNRNYF